MSMLSYKDYCIITRDTGEVDEWDNRVSKEIYNDRCDWQQGGQTSLSNVQSNDFVYLPCLIMVESNDRIFITSRSGRKREGVVKLANDLDLDLTGDWVTEIEIKQSTEKQ